MNATTDLILLSILLLIIAVLYAAIGQAGGTGYIAVMGLMGLGPDVIKPTALALNVLVAAIGSAQFARAGLLTWRSCYPFAILGAPFSVMGGAVHLPAATYQLVVGVLLLLAAWLMLQSRARPSAVKNWHHSPRRLLRLVAGAVIGFVSGVTGVGGGIFLAPVVLVFGWADTRQTAAISAVFNPLNSAAAFVPVWLTLPALPSALPGWLVAVGIGGLLGSYLGARLLSPQTLRYLLAGLLLAAGLRMVLS